MARTITALFDTKADADAGAERLRQAGIASGDVAVHDQTTHKTSGDYSSADDRGIWASIRNVFLPHADRHAYEEGMRRGGFLLTADVEDDDTPLAVAALEDANSVDLDSRAEEWRASGWDYAEPGVDDLEDMDVYGTRDTSVGSVRYRSYRPSDAL